MQFWGAVEPFETLLNTLWKPRGTPITLSILGFENTRIRFGGMSPKSSLPYKVSHLLLYGLVNLRVILARLVHNANVVCGFFRAILIRFTKCVSFISSPWALNRKNAEFIIGKSSQSIQSYNRALFRSNAGVQFLRYPSNIVNE